MKEREKEKKARIFYLKFYFSLIFLKKHRMLDLMLTL